MIAAMLVCINTAAAVADPAPLTITYPLQGALFPRDFRSPTFRWQDTSSASHWQISSHSSAPMVPLSLSVREKKWRPAPTLWGEMKKQAIDHDLTVHIRGMRNGEEISSAEVTIRASADPVQAPIFYREVPLPVTKALKNLQTIQWKLGWASAEAPPRVVLERMEICANCHSFDRKGTVMGMDADFHGDKGAYVLTDLQADTRFHDSDVISWSKVRPKPGIKTFGLFAKLSPSGRYVASTINDIAVYKMLPEISYSQLFFPVQGQIAIYDRLKKSFSVLSGADDPEYVQSNPVFSPDEKSLLFIRSKVLDKTTPVIDFMERKTFYTYDLYRLPFPNSEEVAPVKVPGASDNGMSNYFPKFSPDGNWIVFTQSQGFMIIQPDAQLVIIPAEGGEPRVMSCNFQGKMNSWHSFSPNGKWLVFSAKSDGPYTQLWLTHLNEKGEDSPPVLLENFTAADRAANLPEFVNIDESLLLHITNTLSTETP